MRLVPMIRLPPTKPGAQVCSHPLVLARRSQVLEFISPKQKSKGLGDGSYLLSGLCSIDGASFFDVEFREFRQWLSCEGMCSRRLFMTGKLYTLPIDYLRY